MADDSRDYERPEAKKLTDDEMDGVAGGADQGPCGAGHLASGTCGAGGGAAGDGGAGCTGGGQAAGGCVSGLYFNDPWK